MSTLSPAPPSLQLTFDVERPSGPLNRSSTALRVFAVIPIAIVLGLVGGGGFWVGSGDNATWIALGGPGLLVLPPLLMLVFREKYPRWWFDFNVELLRFTARVGAYAALLTDTYPSTDERQGVQLDIPEPDPARLDRWLPLFKWLLAIPHYIVLAFLYAGVLFAVIGAWFAILFTGRYPDALFDYVVGVGRWHLRVIAYAFALVTDEYPAFRLAA